MRQEAVTATCRFNGVEPSFDVNDAVVSAFGMAVEMEAEHPDYGYDDDSRSDLAYGFKHAASAS